MIDDQTSIRLQPVVTPRSRLPKCLSAGVVVTTLVFVTRVLGSLN